MQHPPKDHNCPVCGDTLIWIYNFRGNLKGYETSQDADRGIKHYPGCPNFTLSVMLPLNFIEYFKRIKEV